MTDTIVLRNLMAICAQLAVLTAVGGALPWLLRVRTPGIIYPYLRLLLVVALILPLAQPWRAPAVTVAPVAEPAPVLDAAMGAPLMGVTSTPISGRVFSSPRVAPLLIMMIAAGAAVRLAWLGFGLARLRRLRRLGTAAALPPGFEDLPRIVGAGAEIRWLDTLRQPVTFGLRRPVVLLPVSLAALDVAQQRTVIAHELIHVQRRDWPWVVAEEILRAVLWFHPAVWWLVSRIQAAREQVVDELTVAATGSRRAYMEALLAFADRPPLAPATAFARRRHLVERMALISKEVVMSSTRLAVSCAAMAAVVIVGGWFAATSFPIEASATMGQASVVQTAKPAPPPPPPPPPAPDAGPMVGHRGDGPALKVMPASLVSPVYPAEARAADARAQVRLSLIVDASGNVTHARVRGISVGNAKDVDQAAMRDITEAFIRAATDAALQWRYEPPGKSTTTNVTIDVRPPEEAKQRPITIPRQSPPPLSWPANAVRVGGDIKPPTKVHHVNPDYPAVAQAARVQGVVILEAVIDEAGNVSHARVLRSIPLLDQAALDTVRQWRFTPTYLNGAPVPVIMTVTINFTLDGSDAPPPPPPPPPPDVH